MKVIKIPIDNQTIKGTLFYPDKLKSLNPAVLFLHGWSTGQKNSIVRAKAVEKKGAICLTFDLRGHGQSDGKLEDFSRADHLKDVLAAYDFLLDQKNVDKEKIGVYGMSYGGYLAAILSSRRNFRWLVLRSPALYNDDDFTVPTAQIIERDPNVYRRASVDSSNKALQSLSNFKGNVLVIESEKDKEVPHNSVKNYLNILKEKPYDQQIIKNADHILSKPVWKQELISIVAEWFEKQFRSN